MDGNKSGGPKSGSIGHDNKKKSTPPEGTAPQAPKQASGEGAPVPSDLGLSDESLMPFKMTRRFTRPGCRSTPGGPLREALQQNRER